MSLQLLVILLPVLFAFMGFAFDLGRLYLIRGELQQAAGAGALAAAARLIGTTGSLDAAGEALRAAMDDSTGHANRYNFGAIVIGDSGGLLTSSLPEPLFFATAAAALGDTSLGGDQADGLTARHVQIDITADAPLLFWSLLALGQSRTTPVIARAVAGISAPLCTACGIEPFAVAAISQEDTADFGFTAGTRYTFGLRCDAPQGTPPPAPLAGAGVRIPYAIIDRLDDSGALDESQQLYRMGAGGLIASTDPARGCVTINNTEQVWASAAGGSCASPPPPGVVAAACGLYSRFDGTPPTSCNNVTEIETLANAFNADTDLNDIEDYGAYEGNARRIVTVPIVDAVTAAGPMTVLAFRQFLMEPNQGEAVTNPGDANARFNAIYIGSLVPLRAGRFDGGCQITAGPGKVVLHQ